jgi:hypothetical protein
MSLNRSLNVGFALRLEQRGSRRLCVCLVNRRLCSSLLFLFLLQQQLAAVLRHTGLGVFFFAHRIQLRLHRVDFIVAAVQGVQHGCARIRSSSRVAPVVVELFVLSHFGDHQVVEVTALAGLADKPPLLVVRVHHKRPKTSLFVHADVAELRALAFGNPVVDEVIHEQVVLVLHHQAIHVAGFRELGSVAVTAKLGVRADELTRVALH